VTTARRKTPRKEKSFRNPKEKGVAGSASPNQGKHHQKTARRGSRKRKKEGACAPGERSPPDIAKKKPPPALTGEKTESRQNLPTEETTKRKKVCLKMMEGGTSSAVEIVGVDKWRMRSQGKRTHGGRKERHPYPHTLAQREIVAVGRASSTSPSLKEKEKKGAKKKKKKKKKKETVRTMKRPQPDTKRILQIFCWEAGGKRNHQQKKKTGP